jgi:hypothetical protein
MTRARTVAEVIAGEAVSGTDAQRIADMRAIASVIANRAALLGVSPEQVVANSTEFNAYNRSLPPGVGQAIVDMAQQQMDYVAENGPVNQATFYATPAAADNLPSGLSYEDATTGHQYFSDPQNRAIGTSLGYIQPNRYAYAQNLDVAGIPTPYSPDDLTNNSLLSAFSATPTYNQDPFDALLSPATPAVNPWGDMAAAKPVQAPMDSVTATGLLTATPALTAQAKANPMMSLAAEGLLGSNPGLPATATVASLPEAADPGFDNSRFDGGTVSVANDFDQGRFASRTFDQSRFGPPSIDVATNTQSFMDQPSAAAAAADLGSFPSAYAAQRQPSTGILSADFQSLVGNTERQLQDPASMAPMVAPQTAMMSVPASGILSANAPLSAQAAVPGTLTGQTTQDVVTPGLLSPSSLVTATPALTTSVPNGILGAQPIQQNAFVSSFPSAVANNTIEPATVNGVVAAPTLDTIQVADQPTVATVEGPATTPAVEQQQTQQAKQAVTQAAKQTAAQTTTPAINAGTITGGVLGSLAAGPVGGVLGGLLGNSAYQGGGIGGLLGPGFSAPTTNIGGGISNIAGLYGGAFSPGSYAVASNGATITAQPGGWTSYTNQYGVTEAIDPNGKISSVWG